MGSDLLKVATPATFQTVMTPKPRPRRDPRAGADYFNTSYSNATPSGSFALNHSFAATGLAKPSSDRPRQLAYSYRRKSKPSSFVPLQLSFSPRPVTLALSVELRRLILRALAKPKRHGALCEKPASAALTSDCKQRHGGPPMVSAALCPRQACHILDGIPQRYELLALTWYRYRREKL
jgi:hypothetical protein